MSQTEHDTTHAQSQPFDLIGAQALADAFIQLLSTQPNEWWLCAERFDGWPLEQPELASALVAWSKARPQGHVYVMAKEFGWVQSEAARFMNWRRLFAHQVMVKRWPQRLTDELHIPKGVYAERQAIEMGLHPTGQLMARAIKTPAQIVVHRHALQALWDKGQQALPAYTLGL
jgi:hypothetical protein